MNQCLAEEQRPWPRISKRWWGQDGVDTEGMRAADLEAERTEGEQDMDGTETDTG